MKYWFHSLVDIIVLFFLQTRKMTSANIPAPVRGHGVGGPDLAQDTGKDIWQSVFSFLIRNLRCPHVKHKWYIFNFWHFLIFGRRSKSRSRRRSHSRSRRRSKSPRRRRSHSRDRSRRSRSRSVSPLLSGGTSVYYVFILFVKWAVVIMIFLHFLKLPARPVCAESKADFPVLCSVLLLFAKSCRPCLCLDQGQEEGGEV